MKNGGKKPCLTFSHVNTRRPYREIHWSDRKKRQDWPKCHNNLMIERAEAILWDMGSNFPPKNYQQSCCRRCCQASEWIEKKTKPDNWWEIKCIDLSSSIVAARQKCPKKVIAANPAACLRAPPLLLGERYERQWCGRGDATFRDFLRWEARKLGHCGRHTAPMQPAMIIRHFSDWATCPSSTGFLHTQNIDLGQSSIEILV